MSEFAFSHEELQWVRAALDFGDEAHTQPLRDRLEAWLRDNTQPGAPGTFFDDSQQVVCHPNGRYSVTLWAERNWLDRGTGEVAQMLAATYFRLTDVGLLPEGRGWKR